MSRSIGETIKLIRNQRGLSKKYVCGQKISLSTYTRIENDSIDTSYDRLLYCLDRLDVSIEELHCLMNDFNRSEKDTLLVRFDRMMQENEKKEAHSLIKCCEKHLQLQQDKFYQMILSLCKGFSSEDSSFFARQIKRVYDQLSEYNIWTEREIKLLRSILPFFEGDQFMKLGEKLIDSIEKRNNQLCKEEIDILQLMIERLISNRLFYEALNYLEKLVQLVTETRFYFVRARAYVNQGTCYSQLGLETLGESMKNKGLSVFKVFNKSIGKFVKD